MPPACIDPPKIPPRDRDVSDTMVHCLVASLPDPDKRTRRKLFSSQTYLSLEARGLLAHRPHESDLETNEWLITKAGRAYLRAHPELHGFAQTYAEKVALRELLTPTDRKTA